MLNRSVSVLEKFEQSTPEYNGYVIRNKKKAANKKNFLSLPILQPEDLTFQYPNSSTNNGNILKVSELKKLAIKNEEKINQFSMFLIKLMGFFGVFLLLFILAAFWYWVITFL